MKDKWLEDIRDKMAEFETDEPDGLWAQIESRHRTYPVGRRRGMWLRLRPWAVAASLAAFFALSCLWLFRGGEKPDMSGGNLVAESPAVKSAGNNAEEIAEAVVGGNAPALPSSVAAMKSAAPVIRAYNAPVADEDVASGEISSEAPAGEGAAVKDAENATAAGEKPVEDDKAAADKSVSEQKAKKRVLARSVDDTEIPLPRKVRRSGRISVGVFTSGGIGLNQAKSSGRANSFDMSNGIYGDATGEGNDKPEAVARSTSSRAAYGKRDYDMHHRQPLRFGLSVRYDITPRLGVETGLSYSRLSSDVRDGGFSRYYSGEQVLHYIGVPLNLKYRLASWKSFDFYTSAGVLGEKCVSGEKSGRDYTNGDAGPKTTVSLHEKRLQWSANVSAGVGFDIVRNVGLYAEPGVSYYFDNGSPVKNIYKDRKLNFNLNLGLRFSFGR